MSVKTDQGYIGDFEGVFSGVAIGWVVNVADPNQKVVVEVLCDGHAVATDRAEIARNDLGQKLKVAAGTDRDTTFGYEIAVPVQALNARASVSIRVANTNVTFTSRDKPVRTKRRQRVSGEVHANGALLLTGWVYPRDYRVSPVELTIEEDGEPIAKLIADDPVPNPGHTGLPALIRGFRYRLPMRLADGDIHILRVFDDTGAELKGSPVSVAAWTSGTADLARLVEDNLPAGSSATQAIQSLRMGFEKSAQYSNPSVSFADYEDWTTLFGPRPTGQIPTKMLNVIIYGDAEPTASVESLKLQEGWIAEVLAFDDLSQKDHTFFERPIVFVRAGDRLHPAALDHAAMALKTNQVVYSDSDQSVDGTVLPWFKPDWDRFLFVSQGYAIGMLAGYFRLGADIELEFASAEELMVEMISQANRDIGHIDQVLYHQVDADAHGEAPVHHESFRQALNQSIFTQDLGGQIVPSNRVDWINRIAWKDRYAQPQVSIIIPTRDKVELLRAAVSTLEEFTSYPNYEIMVVDNNSTDEDALEYLRKLPGQGIRVEHYPGMFNFSAINNFAVQKCAGEIICLLNNDVECFSADWLTEMVDLLMVNGVAAVGAKLLWKNEMVQHGGVVLGIDGGAIHTGNRWARDDFGYAGMNHAMRKNSCVTAACLLIRKTDYESLSGMNHVEFPVTFNDVDLCLRLQANGKEVVWTPHAELYHIESASRGQDELAEKTARAHRELSNLRTKWGKVLVSDPSYNRNLNRDRAPYEGLAMPPFKKVMDVA